MRKQTLKPAVSGLLAFALALGGTAACSPAAYAGSYSGIQTVSAADTVIEGKVRVSTEFNHMMLRAIDKDGSTYYSAFDQAANFTEQVPFFIVKADAQGRITAKAEGGCDKAKIIGDKVYVLTEGGHDENNKPLKGVICKVYDTDLNLLEIFRFPHVSRIQFSDIISGKVCYLSSGKLYVSDMDGQNRKMLCDLSEGEFKDAVCSGAAAAEDHAGITLRKYDDNGRLMTFALAVDLETGRTEINEQPLLDMPESFGDKIIWRSCPDDKGSLFDSSRQYLIWEKGEFKTLKTATSREALSHAAADSEGTVITTGYSNGGSWLKIYKDGKPADKISLSCSPFTVLAENGMIAYCYEEQINGRYYVKAELIPY